MSAIEIQSEISDDQIVRTYPNLVDTMKEHLDLVLDLAVAGVEVDENVLQHMAIAAARVSVEICHECHERANPCRCWDDE